MQVYKYTDTNTCCRYTAMVVYSLTTPLVRLPSAQFWANHKGKHNYDHIGPVRLAAMAGPISRSIS